MLQPAIVQVQAGQDYTLVLCYAGGERRLFDARPYIRGSWYGMLRNPDYFRMARVSPGGRGIEWPEGQDIAPHELYELSVPLEA